MSTIKCTRCFLDSDSQIKAIRQCLSDKRLSWQAKGVYAYIASFSDSISIQRSDLHKQTPAQGIEGVLQAIGELEAADYLTIESIYQNGNLRGIDYLCLMLPHSEGQ